MKNKPQNIVVLFLFVVSCLSSQAQELKKRVTDTEYRYEFFTNSNTPKVKTGRHYYWFRAGAIHTSEFGASGQVLDGMFEKYYLSSQLAEKGTFDKGLKQGEWKNWFTDGKLAERIQYSQGLRNGPYFKHSTQGAVTEEGFYKNDQKHGRWINYSSNDTIVYKDGSIALKKSWIYEMMKKKTPEEKQLLKDEKVIKKETKKVKAEERKQKKVSRKQKAEEKSLEKAAQKSAKLQKTETDKNFFQRLFSKKQTDK